MKTLFLSALTLLMGCLSFISFAATKSYNEGIHLVPLPKNLQVGEGSFSLQGKTSFLVTDPQLKPIAAYFSAKINRSTGYPMPIVEKAKSNCIQLSIDPALKLNAEGYQLTISPKRIEVKGKTAQGVFYGMQTVMQAFPAEIESHTKVKHIDWTAPVMQVSDEPAYGYRGFMLDVCRHFNSMDFIKKQLDVMAMFKLNRFHWHLTDDQRWAIEIKKYPELTQFGSVRKNADGTYERGFFTQEQIKEVIAYAKERFITIIPEIELPGHAKAALSVFPQYSCTGGPFEIRNTWGVEEDVYCAGNDATFDFLADVIKEVCALFPGEYIHIGGDECPKVRWDNCPKCQARMKAEHLKDSHELQSYFVHRIEKIVHANGKKMIGWDEILEGGLAPSATVMSWRGEKGGIAAAKMNHDVIMTPGAWLYIDHGQGAPEVEPAAISFLTTLEKTYSYNPASKEIPDSLKHHVLGAQANLWTEYIATPEYTEYLAYPRLLALSELSWTPVEKKDYNSFVNRLDNQLVRLDEHEVNYHIPLPEGPMADKIAFTDQTILKFHNMRNLPMVYSTDATAPMSAFLPYKGPLTFTQNARVRIATLLPSGKHSGLRTVEVKKEELVPAASAVSFETGVCMQSAKGKFYQVKDVANATWGKETVVKDFSVLPKNDFGAAIYRGYFEVPEDGVYYLSTGMDELKVDGIPVINNSGAYARHTRNRSSLPLQKGKHAFELLVINNNFQGYLRIWDKKGFFIAREGEAFQLPKLLFYK